MNLISLDFGNILLLIVAIIVLNLIYRLVWWLAAVSERAVANLTRTGMHESAKALLAVLINYDERTYHKSRFIVWNQASFRFALLWGGFTLVAIVFGLLRMEHVVDSVALAWLLTFATYVLLRYMVYLTSNRARSNPSGESSFDSSIQHVNERAPFQNRTGHQLIRHYDYLDELFA